MVYDFHTHTSLSDGDLSPIEIIRRASLKGYRAIGLTDHASTGDLDRIVPEVVKVCEMARRHWDIIALPGIELTHLPAAAISKAARKAKSLGAWIVVVHGESIVEPVEPGTNLSAVNSPDVDILAHPGFITEEEAGIAAERGVFIEISARKGHSLTNGHVARIALKAGAKMLVDSDAHASSDLLTDEFALKVVRGTGIEENLCKEILEENSQILLTRIKGLYKKV